MRILRHARQAGAATGKGDMRQLGIDLGGTKIEAAVLDRAGDFLTRIRIPNPGTYEATIRDLCDLVAEDGQWRLDRVWD